MRQAFPDPPSHERNWSVHFTSVATNGAITHYYLGRSRGGLFALRDILLFSSTAIARNATDYYSFRVFVVHQDGSLHYIGTGRGTNTYSVAADVGFRIHDEESLDYHLQRGMALGVEVTSVSSGSLAAARMSMLGSLDYAG
jgi:hypothetical protein